MTSSDTERKTVTKVKHKKGLFLLQHNAFDGKGVNVATVLRAMGVESDQVRAPAALDPRTGRHQESTTELQIHVERVARLA